MASHSPSRFAHEGTILVASGAIGAGMFSLSIVSAGMGFVWAVCLLVVVWGMNLMASLALANINLSFKPGASFHTLVGETLGRGWQRFNDLAILFLMAILLYAYFSAGGSIVQHSLNAFGLANPLPERVSGVLFGTVIAWFVWAGSRAVSRVCTLLLLALFMSFIATISGLTMHVKLANLMSVSAENGRYLWFALPYFVTAFACGGLVPSLVKHYAGNQYLVRRSLIYGTLVTLFVYIVWLAANFGVMSREAFLPLIQQGGNMGVLASALSSVAESQSLSFILTLFANLAITTSFLGIGLGLFDQIADQLHFSNSKVGRLKSAMVSFTPPAILSFLYPKGFILAIGYAGLVVLFSFYLIPAMMLIATKFQELPSSRQFKAALIPLSLILFVVVATVVKLLSIFSGLPHYA